MAACGGSHVVQVLHLCDVLGRENVAFVCAVNIERAILVFVGGVCDDFIVSVEWVLFPVALFQRWIPAVCVCV